MRKEFLVNVSHELKTPIALIQGYAEGLKEDFLEDPESRKEYAGVIVDEAQKMNRMVKQITALNQLEFGQEKPDMEPFDLAALVRGVLTKMDPMITEADAHVTISYPGNEQDSAPDPESVSGHVSNSGEDSFDSAVSSSAGSISGRESSEIKHASGFEEDSFDSAVSSSAGSISNRESSGVEYVTASKTGSYSATEKGAEREVMVIGDAFRIEQVITNYMTNALHHLGGSRLIDIAFRESDGIVETSVFNAGSPIPEEEMEKIWTKFYKIDKARTRAYGGSGIGLSIVKAIMNAHGQTCRAVNYEDGVAFCFTLKTASHL